MYLFWIKVLISLKNKHLTDPQLLNGSMCMLNVGPVLGCRLISCIKFIKSEAWRKTSSKLHLLFLFVCSQLQCSRWMDLHPGLHFSNLDPQVCKCVRVCGLDGGYVLVWVENWAVCKGVFVSCSGRKRKREGECERKWWRVKAGEMRHFDDVNFGFISQMVWMISVWLELI